HGKIMPDYSIFGKRNQELKAIAESAKYIVIGSAICQPEERIHINGKIRSDLINQTGIECAHPWSRTDRIVEFNIATQIPDDRAGKPDRILPLHLHVTAAGFIKDVDPSLCKQGETPRQRVTHR